MKPSRIVLVLVALLAGGLAAFLATRGGNAPRQEAAAPPQVIEEAREEILVAIAPIGLGERLSEKTVQWQQWPAGAVREDYITKASAPDALTEVSGAVARFDRREAAFAQRSCQQRPEIIVVFGDQHQS